MDAKYATQMLALQLFLSFLEGIANEDLDPRRAQPRPSGEPGRGRLAVTPLEGHTRPQLQSSASRINRLAASLTSSSENGAMSVAVVTKEPCHRSGIGVPRCQEFLELTSPG
jgi:hypothetical protein